ncbi:hypothetical protein [Acinetobacter gerneri]|jgi:hypothetical protein|uniref:Uncharacterized protein n=1 Tax=Acinetobacter gerneri DSM 14967 = CIP 107464 = MTCC 9824 TaxID=1120926 RepID=N8Y4W2_9GAMM|nr:hypothetical protein [Acinetobacter gerneri]ENV31787.1 hypothetical protein F960_04156 [Acinetobacter gerneri DSM 14967 = CIP 107464 = MTCC 9824]EPR84024.1 hypothetical protein L289_1728 [Acinetobacter gerneri DSM 14967 = CIP 107464 = MTCC 9824]MCH4243536.1 hypothetical protein [Acinetobacter gerneri]
MDIQKAIPQGHHQTQQLHRQYAANAILPEINWQDIFQYSKLNNTHLQALDAIYRSAVPLALNIFDELKFDVFAPAAFHPQGLGLFDKLAKQEQKLIDGLESECDCLSNETRHQIWSMLLRGGAVLVFKAWLGKVKTGENQLDISQFDELSDLLFIKTQPTELANRLHVNPQANYEHIFLMHGTDIFLDRFNSLETAALFVDLGVYDAAFLSLRDDRVASHLKAKGYVTQEQIDDLQCALNPLNCDELSPNQDCLV